MRKKFSFILLLTFFVLVFVLWCLKRKEGFQSNSFELVVARYSENLDWINSIPELVQARKRIYNKGKPFELKLSNAQMTQLPNVGREGHTYLHHIIENYENLPEYTLFLQGSTGLVDLKKSELETLLKSLRNGLKNSLLKGSKDKKELDSLSNFTIETYVSSHSENFKANPESALQLSPYRPLGKWLDHHFPGEQIECISYRGLVLAKRDDIYKRPKSFYKTLAKELETSSNPEVGHYLERAWHLLFSMPSHSCLV